MKAFDGLAGIERDVRLVGVIEALHKAQIRSASLESYPYISTKRKISHHIVASAQSP